MGIAIPAVLSKCGDDLVRYVKHSLLMFDIVKADELISDELKKEIEKDGVVIYEKT